MENEARGLAWVRGPMSNGERLLQLVDRFPERRLAVLGDLVVDEFVHGDLSRVSREAPVLILRQRGTTMVPGGGGNAVANLRALDARPLPVGVVGDDEPGSRLLQCFRELGIDTSGILVDRRYQTPAKSRIMAGGIHTRRQQVVRLDRGELPGELRPAIRNKLSAKLRAALKRTEGLLVADYGYGAATPELVQAANRRAATNPLQVTVDSRGRIASYRGVTACSPNEEELEQALGIPPLSNEQELEAAGLSLLRRCRSRALLVTRGARGMCVFERRRQPVYVPAFGSGEVADVTGAGDTVVAALSLGLLVGGTFHEAALLANYAAGLVVMKAGTATVGREELAAAIRDDLG